MSFSEHQLRGGLYTKPREYCTCDRCGITLLTSRTRQLPGKSGPQHVCSDVKVCDRMKRHLDKERAR